MPTFVHGKRTKILLDQYDITQFFREASGGITADEVDTTAFGAGDYKTYIGGFVGSTLSLNGMFENTTDIDPVTAGVQTLDQKLDEILADDTVTRKLSVGIDGFAAGTRVRMFEGTELNYDISGGVGDVVTATADFSSASPSKTGYSLHDLVSETATANGTSVDGGTGRTAAPVGGSTFGAIAQLHVTANTRSTSSTFRVQHSADNVTWVDLITFDAVASSTLSSQRKQVSGNVNRYFRAVWTYTAGTGAATFHISVARLNA